MIIFDIICFIATIELLRCFCTAVEKNFESRKFLKSDRDMGILIRLGVFCVLIVLTSMKFKVFAVVTVFTCLFILVKHIESENSKRYRDNDDLFSFYIYEIKKFKNSIYISAIFCSVFLIVGLLCK